ncbi:uncharacterized protein ACUXIR_000558 [Staphylococcus hominis]
MKQEQQISLAKEYMYQFHKNDYSGHDIAHIKRVTSLAKYIAKQEHQGDFLTIVLSALLHDVIDNKLTDKKHALRELNRFFKEIELEDTVQKHVIFIIKHLSYSNGKNDDIQLSIEGQIVRDADRLDAIGAIGIARAFQFSGHFNELMWTESPHSSVPSEDEIVNLPPSAIRHFYDKLLKLKSLMHTPTGYRLAKERHEFMKAFLTQFYNEWHVAE